MSKALPKRLAGLRLREGAYALIMVPNYWGRGDTIEEAAAKVRAAGGGKHLARGTIRVYEAEEHENGRAFIDGMGGLNWWGDRPRVIFEEKGKRS